MTTPTRVVLTFGGTEGEAAQRRALARLAPSLRRLLEGFAGADESTSASISGHHVFHSSTTCQAVEHQRVGVQSDGRTTTVLRWRDGNVSARIAIEHDADAAIDPRGRAPLPAIRLARVLDALLGPDAPTPLDAIPE